MVIAFGEKSDFRNIINIRVELRITLDNFARFMLSIFCFLRVARDSMFFRGVGVGVGGGSSIYLLNFLQIHQRAPVRKFGLWRSSEISENYVW